MGNTQSSKSGRYSTTGSSKTSGLFGQRRDSTTHTFASSNNTGMSPAIRRRSTNPASPYARNSETTPPPPQSHRRARSTLVGSSSSIRNRDVLPPPPYSEPTMLEGDDGDNLVPPPTPASPIEAATWVRSESPASSPSSLSPRRTQSTPLSPGSPPRSRNSVVPPPRMQSIPEAGSSSTSRHAEEDPLHELTGYNTVFVVDDSASMRGPRWKEATEVLSKLAEVAAGYDTDGIDICFFNNHLVGQNLRSSDAIRHLFASVQPQGITPMGARLESLLLFYLDTLERAKREAESGNLIPISSIKKVNYIVITDGAPTDSPEDVIAVAARRLDRGNFPLTQLGIQFVQIGDNPDATEFLQRLDDDLGMLHECRDMVDTTPYNNGEPFTHQLLLKILVGAINRRIDRDGSAPAPRSSQRQNSGSRHSTGF